MAKSSAIAVRHLSPPDNRSIFWSFFPGGCAIMSILQLRTSCSSPSTISAIPPPNNSAKTSLKFSLITRKWVINCFFISDVISEIIFKSLFLVSSMSSRCPTRNSYLSATFSYSSIAFILIFPSSLISFLSSFTLRCAIVALSIWILHFAALSVVSSYCSQSLFLASSRAVSTLTFLPSDRASSVWRSEVSCAAIWNLS